MISKDLEVNKTRTMRLLAKLTFISIVAFLTSCSAMKYNISRNNKLTDKTIFNLNKEYGNVFYVRSTYATFSTVWSYVDNSIKIYKLANGRLIDQQQYPTNGIEDFKIMTNDELLELNQCMELDGDIFGYSILKGEQIDQRDFPVGIECFTKINFKSNFLKKIVDDINTFKIWEIHYK